MTAAADLSRRLWRLRELLRLTPFETESPEDRAKERHRRMLLSTLASATAKAVSVATALISIPLTLTYLGAERYGMWLAVSSFIAILAFADLGLGNGLLNQIAAAKGRDDRSAIRTYVSGGFGILILVASVILAVFWSTYPFVTWSGLFNVSDPLAVAEAGPAMAVFAVCFALSIPATIVQKVQIGLQESFLASLWQCLGSVLALGGLILATQMKLGLPWLVLAFLGGPLIAGILNSLVFFVRSQPDIAPRFSAFSTRFATQTLRAGLLFLVLQVVAAASYSSDPLIIAHLLGPEAVPQYAVPERMFSLVAMVIGMGLAPLWPAYGEAISRADHGWVRKTFFRSIVLAGGISFIVSMSIALAGDILIDIWVGPSIQVSMSLLFGLAIWKVIEACGNAASVLLNGANFVRFQVVVSIVSGGLILFLKFPMIERFGVSGAVWASVIGVTVAWVVPVFYKIRTEYGRVGK